MVDSSKTNGKIQNPEQFIAPKLLLYLPLRALMTDGDKSRNEQIGKMKIIFLVMLCCGLFWSCTKRLF